jgi:hypothetical protein
MPMDLVAIEGSPGVDLILLGQSERQTVRGANEGARQRLGWGE